eukprot:351457-Chlamydomonas_euryale.AAC.4
MDVQNVRALAVLQISKHTGQPQTEHAATIDVYCTFILPYFLYGYEEHGHGQRFRLAGYTSLILCLRRIVSVKLTDRFRLETVREQCGTCSLELLVRRRTLQWMEHISRRDGDHLPQQVFDCSTARSAAEDGHMEH